MAKDINVKQTRVYKSTNHAGSGGFWFAGFIGALLYYIRFHSGTFLLVVWGIIKAIFWPAVLVYHILLSLHV